LEIRLDLTLTLSSRRGKLFRFREIVCDAFAARIQLEIRLDLTLTLSSRRGNRMALH
jgi:hypothetical protein